LRISPKDGFKEEEEEEEDEELSREYEHYCYY
jgi:hypothetical protein